MRLAGGSPQADLKESPRGLHTTMYVGFPKTILSNPGPPQAELLSGSLPTTRTATREAPHKQNYDQGAGRITPRELVVLLAGWLAGWGAGWLAQSQRGPDRPREADRGWNKPVIRLTGGYPQAELRPGSIPTSRITTWQPTHKQNYDQGTGWLDGWLAGGITTREPVMRLAGWLLGAGWMAESQRGPKCPREAEHG